MAFPSGLIKLPSGRLLSLADNCTRPMLIPWDFKLDGTCGIYFSNATVVGYSVDSAHRVVVVRGEAGRQGVLAANGRVAEFVFPRTHFTPVALTAGFRPSSTWLTFLAGTYTVASVFTGTVTFSQKLFPPSAKRYGLPRTSRYIPSVTTSSRLSPGFPPRGGLAVEALFRGIAATSGPRGQKRISYGSENRRYSIEVMNVSFTGSTGGC